MSIVFTLFTTYLIYPIIGLIMILVAALLVKKNGLLKNKRLIVYTLLSIPILTVPALLGFLDYNFMPYAYIALAGVYILVGFLNDRLLPPGTAFDPYRQRDFERRQAEGFPKPLYPSRIDTPDIVGYIRREFVEPIEKII